MTIHVVQLEKKANGTIIVTSADRGIESFTPPFNILKPSNLGDETGIIIPISKAINLHVDTSAVVLIDTGGPVVLPGTRNAVIELLAEDFLGVTSERPAIEPAQVMTAGQTIIYLAVIKAPTTVAKLAFRIEGNFVTGAALPGTIISDTEIGAPAFTGGETVEVMAFDNN